MDKREAEQALFFSWITSSIYHSAILCGFTHDEATAMSQKYINMQVKEPPNEQK